MQKVSSSLTLMLKLALPIFWIVFFAMFILAFARTPEAHLGSMPRNATLLLLIASFSLFVLVLYFTLMSLKRVEFAEDFVYITNYFKTFRYPVHNIERLEEKDYSLFHLGKIHFKQSGHFGKSVFFLSKHYELRDVLDQFPHWKSLYK